MKNVSDMMYNLPNRYIYPVHHVTDILLYLPMKMEPIGSSETSAIKTQTTGNYPKRNILQLKHGESLETSVLVALCEFKILCFALKTEYKL